MDEAIKTAQDAAGRSQFLFTLNTLEFLHRGGRIGAAQRLIGTALSIKPILGLKDGIVVPVETVRTRQKAIDRLLEMATRYADKRPLWAGIIHSNAPELNDFQQEIQNRLKPDVLVVTPASPAVGVYAGPGAIGLGIVPGR
jgi:DegV family protein with EDD domain